MPGLITAITGIHRNSATVKTVYEEMGAENIFLILPKDIICTKIVIPPISNETGNE